MLWMSTKKTFGDHYTVRTHPSTGHGMTVTSNLFPASGLERTNRVLGEYSQGAQYLTGQQGEAARIEAIIARYWPATWFPFETPSVDKIGPLVGDKPSAEYWALEAGDVSRVRLAHYYRITGIGNHALHGGLGKMIDVLGVAAGLVDRVAVEARPQEPELDYIDFNNFLEELKLAPDLSPGAKSEIRTHIYYSLKERALPVGAERDWSVSYSEVVVEGSLEWKRRGSARVAIPEYIAPSSLVNLFEGRTNKPFRDATDYLSQYASEA